MLDSERLEYRRPFPLTSSGYVEGLMMDDRVGVQLFPKEGWHRHVVATAARDQEAFARSAELYAQAGLDVNEKKAIRRAVVWEAWGGQTEGDTGWTGPPRRKLLKLLQITLELAKGGVVDLQLLSSLLGSWAFFLQFRRCLYSVIDALYKEGPPRGRQRGTFSVDSSRSQRTDYP